jgi:hypothetical protein
MPAGTVDGTSLPGYPGNLFAVPELRSGRPGKVFAVHGAASSKKIYVRAVVILESYVYL